MDLHRGTNHDPAEPVPDEFILHSCRLLASCVSRAALCCLAVVSYSGLVHPELVPSSRGTSCNTHGDMCEPCSRNGGGNPTVQPQHQMPTSGRGDAFLRVTEGPGW